MVTTAAGLPPIRLHDLRDVAATLMLAAGVDVKVVSETLGHSDTRDIYQAVLDDTGPRLIQAGRATRPALAAPSGAVPDSQMSGALTLPKLQSPKRPSAEDEKSTA
ncbi:tyrosine-type recombinase/integrase [Streptomyces hygroscopicus]|uniref:tyrosine-type recombinase/integrase n=1 Tax=Streptomyces hygroscopicus TaxID=1912 RepID=UPI003A102ACA